MFYNNIRAVYGKKWFYFHRPLSAIPPPKGQPHACSLCILHKGFVAPNLGFVASNSMFVVPNLDFVAPNLQT